MAADTSPAAARMLARLADPRARFDRDQLAFMMAMAARWAREAVEGEPSPETYTAGWDDGYRARVEQENATHPPPVMVLGGRWVDQTDYRRRCDAAARTALPTDYRGGPIQVWPSTWCGELSTHFRHPSTVRPDGYADAEDFVCEGRP